MDDEDLQIDTGSLVSMLDIFCDNFEIEKPAYTSNMRCATADGITIINFGMGSPNAAIIMDLLSAISPKACLFLGKCGGKDAAFLFHRSLLVVFSLV